MLIYVEDSLAEKGQEITVKTQTVTRSAVEGVELSQLLGRTSLNISIGQYEVLASKNEQVFMFSLEVLTNIHPLASGVVRMIDDILEVRIGTHFSRDIWIPGLKSLTQADKEVLIANAAIDAYSKYTSEPAWLGKDYVFYVKREVK